jgi:Protein of unknown function (DUF3592)
MLTPFTLFRYGLIPVAYYCLVVITAGISAFSGNAVQKSTWRQTVVTVTQAQDFGDAAAEFLGTKNTFPDPRGTVKYVIDGETFVWQGRGREIGLTVMKPGDQIKLYYNPKSPQEISSLVMLGASTGSIILAVAVAFLVFYVWFFWLRGLLRRSGPDDLDGDMVGAFAEGVSERAPSPIEQPRVPLRDPRPAAINNRSVGRSFDRTRTVTFGKR